MATRVAKAIVGNLENEANKQQERESQKFFFWGGLRELHNDEAQRKTAKKKKETNENNSSKCSRKSVGDKGVRCSLFRFLPCIILLRR